ncbi:MAG: HAD family phosphatase [Gammaproteobacteria bacterium]|nr:HAD family phosphatase [Gammaproteobacteria bacterium]
MQYKALALDLDGTTLVGEDLPKANKLALQKAHEAGYEIIVATARWLQLAQRITDEIGVRSIAIACSGAQVYDPVAQADIFDKRLPADFVQALYDICNADRCIATVTVTDRVLLKLDGEPDLSLMGPELNWVPQLSVEQNNLPRIAAIQGSAVCQRIKEELKPRYNEVVNVFDSIGPSGKLVITITAKAANKGTALQAACDHLNIAPNRVIAFGDAENDLAMFAIAGASVAMGQASEEVKAAANYISAANYEDGVAQAIELILANGTLP